MSSGKTILLTGGTGFLGSNLLRKLAQEDSRIILLKRPSSNTSRILDVLEGRRAGRGRVVLYNITQIDLKQLFLNEPVDTIIHCATNYGRKDTDPIEMLEANLILPLTLLQLGSRNKVSCFINTDTILDKRISRYSLSKSQFKEWLKVYSSSMTCVNVALEHFYGPYDNETKFVTYIVRSIINNVDKIDLTAGEQKRDFIYIDDVVDAFMRILSHSGSFEKGFFNYEVGTGETITLREFVTMVKRLADNSETSLNFGAFPYRENEIMEFRVDTSEIRKLGWAHRFSLEEGLKRTIEQEKTKISL